MEPEDSAGRAEQAEAVAQQQSAGFEQAVEGEDGETVEGVGAGAQSEGDGAAREGAGVPDSPSVRSAARPEPSPPQRLPPPRPDPEQAKRRRLDDQLRRNADLLRELDGAARAVPAPVCCTWPCSILDAAAMVWASPGSHAADVCWCDTLRGGAQAGGQPAEGADHRSHVFLPQGADATPCGSATMAQQIG